MTSTKSTVFAVSGCMLLAASIVFARHQDHELSGIHGIPVEGHDIVAGIEIKGTKELLLSGSGWRKLRERLRANGAELRLGWPLESQTRCRFKEVVLDVMNEKGFLDAEIGHDMRPTYGDSRNVTLRGHVARPFAGSLRFRLRSHEAGAWLARCARSLLRPAIAHVVTCIEWQWKIKRQRL